MSFNPDDFFKTITVQDILEKFPQIAKKDFSKISLNEELIKLNYEITSQEYKDFISNDVKDYYHFKVDEIV